MTPQQYILKAEEIALRIENDVDKVAEKLKVMKELTGEADAQGEDFANKVEKLSHESEVLQRVEGKFHALFG